jgi:putative transposase
LYYSPFMSAGDARTLTPSRGRGTAAPPSDTGPRPAHRVTADTARRRALRRARPGTQLSLPLPKPRATWGGARRNAGRKPAAQRPGTPHRARPPHEERHPVHVTLRSRFGSLRSDLLFPTVRLAIARAGRRDPDHFRIVHFSVQYDHIHLVVEAASQRALGAGVRSVSIRVALYVNELLLRHGRFWADRWHGRALTTPRAVRNAVVYVLANFRKHARAPLPAGLDPCSSAAWFRHFRGFDPARGPTPFVGRPPLLGTADEGTPVSPSRSWLLTAGLARTRPLELDEAPRPAQPALATPRNAPAAPQP